MIASTGRRPSGHRVRRLTRRRTPPAARHLSDYDDALEIARNPDAPVAQPAVMEARIADGRLKIVENPADVPATLAGLDIHRLLSSRTS